MTTLTPTKPANIRTFADIKREIAPITFHWKPFLPDALLTIITSESGEGKSTIMIYLAGIFLMGWDWPDGTKFTGETGAVLWCEAEAAQAINLERAERWGLPLEKIYTPTDDPLEDIVFDNPKHRAAILEKAKLPEVKFICFDSLSGSTRRNEKDTGIKGVSQFLAMVARDAKKPVLLSHHLRKKTQWDPETISLDRVRGFSGIVQYARVIWALDHPDPNHPEKKRLSMIKNNLAKMADPIGVTITDKGVNFGPAPQEPRKETRVGQAIDLLMSLLAKGPMLQTEIEKNFDGAGISTRTMQRAKEELGIVSTRSSNKWYWGLPFNEDNHSD